MLKQELTNWLLSIINKYEYLEDSQIEDIKNDLLNCVRSYYPIELSTRSAIIKTLSDEELSEEDESLISQFINTIKKNGIEYKDFSIVITFPKPVEKVSPQKFSTAAKEYKKPQNWLEIISLIQKQLFESNQPFENYNYPVLQSKSLYSQCYKALCNDFSKGSFSIIIPDLISEQEEQESKKIWENKKEIINQLLQINTNIHNGKLVKIISYDQNPPCSYIILENNKRNLEQRLKESGQIKANTAISLGIALCNFLEELNDFGLVILNLSPNNICFEDNEGLKELVLLEPTEIYPKKGIIPDFNDFDFEEIKELYSTEKTSIQCFLISSLVAYILNYEELNNNDIFNNNISFIIMTAFSDFNENELERAVEPFANKLEKRFYEEPNIDFHKLTKVLRWGLEPSSQKRYQSLNQLKKDLKSCFI